MSFQNFDWEALLGEDSQLPPDVCFKVYDDDSVLAHAQVNVIGEMDEDIESFKIFKAHKFLLAAVSPMFHKQFFGSLPAPQMAEPVTVKQTSSKAFGIMLDFLYQKDEPFSFPCGDFACLFEVKNLGEKYQIADLVLKTDIEISSRQLSNENLVETTKSSKIFHHLFTEISEELLERCANFFTKNYQSLDKIRMLIRDHKDSELDTEAIMTLIKLEAANCDGCKRSSKKCLNGKSVTEGNVVVGAKVVRDMTRGFGNERVSDSFGVGVLVRKDCESFLPSHMWYIMWENGVENGSWPIGYGGYFLFKCH